MWMRLAWEERGKEEEGVIPSTWVDKARSLMFWPPGVNAEKFLNERRPSAATWRRFKLTKIKYCSGNCFYIL